jgi:hypothetical protein
MRMAALEDKMSRGSNPMSRTVHVSACGDPAANIDEKGAGGES